MKRWVDKGWSYTDKHWPFGRGEYREEGATLVLGSLKEEVTKTLASSDRRRALFKLVQTINAVADGKPREKKPWEPSYLDGLLRGRKEGRKALTQYPLSCDIFVTLFTSKSIDFPGLVLATCVGCANRPGSDSQVLANFRMRVVHPGIRSNLGLEAPLSYGRRLDKSWIDLSIARWWIYECESKHGTMCTQHGWDIVMRKPKFIRVIDVENMCLVEPAVPSTCRYVALSYTWGETPAIKLKYENRISFMKQGGLRRILPRIPKTILDAMEVVIALGEKYLWVDSLVSQFCP
jgi:hypothetical protein